MADKGLRSPNAPRKSRDDDFRETLAPTAPSYVDEDVEPAYLASERDRTLSGVELFVGWIAGILIILLAIRFIFSLLAINQANSFASFVYSVTNGFVAPFNNLFNFQITSGLGYFDLPAVVAIAVVALVAWALTRVLRLPNHQ